MLQAKKSNRKRSLKMKNVREKAWSLEIQREKELEILCKEIKIKKKDEHKNGFSWHKQRQKWGNLNVMDFRSQRYSNIPKIDTKEKTELRYKKVVIKKCGFFI